MLREWRDEDLDPFAAMSADPEVMRYIGDGTVRDRADAATSLGRIRAHWAETGFGHWALEVRAGGAFVGFCGVAFPRFLPALATSPEIGWRLVKIGMRRVDDAMLPSGATVWVHRVDRADWAVA